MQACSHPQQRHVLDWKVQVLGQQCGHLPHPQGVFAGHVVAVLGGVGQAGRHLDLRLRQPPGLLADLEFGRTVSLLGDFGLQVRHGGFVVRPLDIELHRQLPGVAFAFVVKQMLFEFAQRPQLLQSAGGVTRGLGDLGQQHPDAGHLLVALAVDCQRQGAFQHRAGFLRLAQRQMRFAQAQQGVDFSLGFTEFGGDVQGQPVVHHGVAGTLQRGGRPAQTVVGAAAEVAHADALGDAQRLRKQLGSFLVALHAADRFGEVVQAVQLQGMVAVRAGQFQGAGVVVVAELVVAHLLVDVADVDQAVGAGAGVVHRFEQLVGLGEGLQRSGQFMATQMHLPDVVEALRRAEVVFEFPANLQRAAELLQRQISVAAGLREGGLLVEHRGLEHPVDGPVR